MSFNSSNFSRIGYFGGSNRVPSDSSKVEWSYSTADSFSTVGAANYFNGVDQKIRAGDFIYVSSSADGDAAFYVDTANPGDTFVRKMF